MTGVGSLYLLLFPLIMMTSFAGISVHISLTMGGLRAPWAGSWRR